jgi:hypothetical protein
VNAPQPTSSTRSLISARRGEVEQSPQVSALGAPRADVHGRRTGWEAAPAWRGRSTPTSPPNATALIDWRCIPANATSILECAKEAINGDRFAMIYVRTFPVERADCADRAPTAPTAWAHITNLLAAFSAVSATLDRCNVGSVLGNREEPQVWTKLGWSMGRTATPGS